MSAKSKSPDAAQRKVWKAELKQLDAAHRKISADFLREQKRLNAEILKAEKNFAAFNRRAGKARLAACSKIDSRRAVLLYACGLRVQSTCELRIKDFDLDRMVLTIHEDKGDKDRQVPIPESLLPAIRRQIARATLMRAAAAKIGELSSGFIVRLYDAACEVKFPSSDVTDFRHVLQHQAAKNLGLAAFKAPKS